MHVMVLQSSGNRGGFQGFLSDLLKLLEIIYLVVPPICLTNSSQESDDKF